MQLTVRGAYPLNFFVLLKDGIEKTLERFPGLQIKRQIPCLGNNGKPCIHEFDYEQVQKRLQKQKLTIECPEATEDEDVSVTALLQGLYWTKQDAVLDSLNDLKNRIDKGNDEIKDKLENLLELTQREFTNAFRCEQSKIDFHCPNVFVLRPHGGKVWKQTIAGKKLYLQLYYQAPGCWHPTQESGLYEINQPAK